MMNAYIYQAALWCESCGDEIRARLTADGQAPESPDDESTYDSDEYPKGPYSDGGGEADCPQNCDGCKAFLDNPLTADGVSYVIDAVRDATDRHGSRSDVLDEWTDHLWTAGYSLDVSDDDVLDAYRALATVQS